jgi:hypothetical protein
MTEPDNFIQRWARLKRKSNAAQDAEPHPASTEATAPPPRVGVATEQSFDLATLPSLESIAADTKIGAFLQSGVPAELTRAALRRAWGSDPAIRDFIGIAENQWDFNDPGAIPGFGPLHATDNVPVLLAQVSRQPENILKRLVEMPASVERDEQGATVPGRLMGQQDAQLTPDESSTADSGDFSLSSEIGEADPKAGNAHTGKEADASRNRRHGSALPR